jgi:hypothetical protein
MGVQMKQTTRQTYDLLDMIRVARRFKSENNYMVLPDDIAEQLEDELARLFELDDLAQAQLQARSEGGAYLNMDSFLDQVAAL